MNSLCQFGYKNHRWKLMDFMMIGGRANYKCERCGAMAHKSTYHSAYKITAQGFRDVLDERANDKPKRKLAQKATHKD